MNDLQLNLKLRQELLQHARAANSAMQVNLVLYIVFAALVVLVAFSFICFLVVSHCKRRRKSRKHFSDHRHHSDWIRSASIEHLRFTPPDRQANVFRASTPHDYESAASFDFVRWQNGEGGLYHSGYINPLDMIKNPVETQEINHNSNPPFQTFGRVSEPKYIYWETRV